MNVPRTFPQDYDPAACALVPVPCSLLPIIAGKLAELEQESQWATREDWEQGYQATLEVEAAMMTCGQSITTSLESSAAVLIALLAPTTSRETAMTALATVTAGLAAGNPSDEWNAAIALLTNLQADAVGKRTDQTERYLYAINLALGFSTEDEPEPEPETS